MATANPTIGTCIFCGEVGPLEREHVLAQWIRKELGILGHRRHRTIRGLDLKVTHRWSNPIATARVRCVCYDCNHRWMKALEERVKGGLGMMMRQGLTILAMSADINRDLAAWTLKTAAVAQELPGNTLKPINAAMRRYLYEKLEPPPGTTGWVSPSPAPEVDALVQVATLDGGYVAQIVVGYIRLAAIGSFSGQRLEIQPSDVLGVDAIEIWPSRPGWSRSPVLPVLSQSGRPPT